MGLSASSFKNLLTLLDSNPESASDKYLILHQKLATVAEWRGCPESESDSLADEVFDRIVKKIAEGTEIENVDSYAKGVLRYIILERYKGWQKEIIEDDLPIMAITPKIETETDETLKCLRLCIPKVLPDQSDRKLIVEYYESEPGEPIKEKRKRIAEKAGITMNNLKVKVCRIRRRLEQCINECFDERNVTNSSESITTKQREKRDG